MPGNSKALRVWCQMDGDWPARYWRIRATATTVSASKQDTNQIRDVSHLLWTGNPLDATSSGRNAVFYGDKAIDRSPCGTGTSARLAQLYAKGKLQIGEEFIHESYIGSKFIGRVERETTLDEKQAIVPSIQGWAKIYGYNTIVIDEEDDPYAHGFQVI